MEGCSRMSVGAVSGLPEDPLVEILSRVPAKSVCRFKCVSKAWRDLIAHPDHRKKLRQAMQGLFVQTRKVDNTKLFGQTSSFSFIGLTVRSVPLDLDPCFSFLTELTGIQNLSLRDSCNGLILFRHGQEPSHLTAGGYIVCNPTTKQWSAVPACVSPSTFCHTYLAFDPAISSHFHLVQFQRPNLDGKILSLHVYSSETGTWSQNQIAEQKEQGQLQAWHHQFTLEPVVVDTPQCAFFNGFLHLIVRASDGQHILAVDVQGKARRMITVPRMAGFICYIGQSQGHLHCVTLESADEMNEELSIWVLQDYSTQEWVLNDTVKLSIFGENCTRVTSEFPMFKVVGIHQDCNVVFFFQHLRFNCKLTAYNMDRKELSVIATFKDYKFRTDFARYVPYFSESPALTNKH